MAVCEMSKIGVGRLTCASASLYKSGRLCSCCKPNGDSEAEGFVTISDTHLVSKNEILQDVSLPVRPHPSPKQSNEMFNGEITLSQRVCLPSQRELYVVLRE